MSVSAYFLARRANSESLTTAARQFADNSSIERWDAVEGHVQIILRVKGDLSRIDGFDDLIRYEIVDDGENGTPLRAEDAHAYLFIETETASRDIVRRKLGAIDGVLWSSATRGGCDIVAVVQGRNFDAVERLAHDEIRTLDGVVRLKVARIIDLRQL